MWVFELYIHPNGILGTSTYIQEVQGDLESIIIKEVEQTQELINPIIENGGISPSTQGVYNLADQIFQNNFALDEAQMLEDYQSSQFVQNAINNLHNNKTKCLSDAHPSKPICVPPELMKESWEATWNCSTYVKRALDDARPDEFYYIPCNAYDCHKNKVLKKQCYVNLMELEGGDKYKSSQNMPVGAVIVQSGGRYGHIEVKAGPSSYVSDYETSAPAHERRARYVEVVYIKPSDEFLAQLYKQQPSVVDENCAKTKGFE